MSVLSPVRQTDFPVSTQAAAAQLRETEARHHLKPGAISPGATIASPAVLILAIHSRDWFWAKCTRG